MDELLKEPISGLADAIRSKKMTSKQMTRAFLDRIESVNPALNAVVRLGAEEAMKFADRADLALQGGETPGKLFGVPMTIKDSLDTFDMVTTWGTEGRKDFRPGKDATCVGRLRNEGAILMGKTNTPEFTMAFTTDNLLFGRTNNPYDVTRTPGGSSGGAAAIIAAGGSPFDVGTDTGGSIRLPSHFCGIAGIKPTTGRVPCTGNALPSTGLMAPLSQPGPMAKKVEDLIYLLPIMMGPDNIDPHCVPANWQDPAAINVEQLRFGYHTDNGIKTPDDAIVSTVNSVIELLASEQIRASEVRPTGLEMAGFIYSQVYVADCAGMLSALLEDCRTSTPSTQVANVIAGTSQDISSEEYAQVINLWQNYQSSMLGYFDDFDILICPVNAHTAMAHDSAMDSPRSSFCRRPVSGCGILARKQTR
jgi:amidase